MILRIDDSWLRLGDDHVLEQMTIFYRSDYHDRLTFHWLRTRVCLLFVRIVVPSQWHIITYEASVRMVPWCFEL